MNLYITFFSLLTGLMADELGSYASTFYTSGTVLVGGASITSLITFTKKQRESSEETESYNVEELLVTDKVTVLYLYHETISLKEVKLQTHCSDLPLNRTT